MPDPTPTWRRLLDWFGERKLLQVLAIYVAASWAVLEVTDVFIDKLGLPAWFFPAAVILLLIGLAVVVTTAFVEYGVPQQASPRAAPEPGTALVDRLPRLTWRRALLGGVLAFGALGAAGAVWMATRGADEPPAFERPSNAVAVLPFRVTGPNLDVWREGLMDVLSANLDGVGDLRAVDTRTVLSRWNSRASTADAPLATALEVARELGARWAVVGQAVELGGQVRLDTRFYATDSSEPVTASNVVGAPDSILQLIEGVTLDLLRGLGREQGLGDRGRAFTSTSMEAVKAFLEGEQQMRRSEWAAAAEHFERALAIDSTFAMAAARLSAAYGWQYSAGHSAATAAAAQALRFADQLPPRERTLLEFTHVFEEGRLESLELARRLTTRYPDDPEAWYQLGEAYYHLGGVATIPVEEWSTPFERAVALDSSFIAPLIHLIELAARAHDMDRFDRLSRLYLARDSTSSWAGSLRTAHALMRGTGPDSIGAIEGLGRLSRKELSQTALILLDAGRRDPVERVIYEMAAPHRPSDERSSALYFWINLVEIWRGRPGAAQAALDLAAELAPDNRSIPFYQLSNIVHGMGDTSRAAAAIDRGQQLGLFERPLGRWLLGVYHLKNGGDVRALAHADTLELLADSLRAGPDSLDAVRAEGLALGLRGLVAGHRGEHSRAATLLRSAVPRSSGHGAEWVAIDEQQMGLASSLIELGQEAEALRILDSAFYVEAYYDARAALARGQIYERRGEREKAMRAYSRMVALWSDCEPELRPQRELAERALNRLMAEG